VQITTQNALSVWQGSLAETVRRDGPDLSSRQMAILLTVYLSSSPHTVRGLAETLGISKPAVVRALDMLGRLDFIRRRRDDADRRNIFVQRTIKGSVFLSEFAEIVVNVADDV
jgi:DNA-binding MarR family transcriptional regulator